MVRDKCRFDIKRTWLGLCYGWGPQTPLENKKKKLLLLLCFLYNFCRGLSNRNNLFSTIKTACEAGVMWFYRCRTLWAVWNDFLGKMVMGSAALAGRIRFLTGWYWHRVQELRRKEARRLLSALLIHKYYHFSTLASRIKRLWQKPRSFYLISISKICISRRFAYVQENICYAYEVTISYED